jgi:hypothetical protein
MQAYVKLINGKPGAGQYFNGETLISLNLSK